MAKPSLANITTAQTFQNWFDKTNELVNLFKSDAITASGPGDTTTGNATLTGTFTSTNLIADTLLSADTITSKTAAATINFNAPIQINGSSATVATFAYGASGGRTRYTDGSFSWDVGMENSAQANFIINTGVGVNKFQLSPAGTLTIPNIVVLEGLTSDTITVDTLNVTNIVGGSVGISDLNDFTTNDLAEGSNNLYYTSARANAAIDARVNKTFVDNLGINASTVGGVAQSVFLRNNASGTLTGTLTILGELLVTGDITTEYSTSDARLKENLMPISNALDKVNTLNGYTFNYIRDEEKERVAGLLAQDVEKVLPEVVYEYKSGINGDFSDIKAIRYGNMVSLLVEAIKELKAKVDELEKNKCTCNCDK
jgi:hypothetical protein